MASRPYLGCVHPGSAQYINDQGCVTLADVWPTGQPGDARRTPDERLGRAVARYVLGVPRCNAALIQARRACRLSPAAPAGLPAQRSPPCRPKKHGYELPPG